MGKEFSKEIQDNTEVARRNASPLEIQRACSKKALTKVHKRVVEEYPYLKNVYEAMLVTDNRLPDNPIVFANDNFQKMTCYSREEIIGRNCRFLQGKYSEKQTIRTIRKAVDDGLELDVELLNYRKDGVPFWNSFLMLPIHNKNPKKVKTGELNPVTHFIAIQKDVTVLKQGRSNPAQWKPVEVAFYFDFMGLGQYGESCISNSISGDVFLSLDDDDLKALGVAEPLHRDYILKRIDIIKKDNSRVYEELRIGRILQTGTNDIEDEEGGVDTFDCEDTLSFHPDHNTPDAIPSYPLDISNSYTSPSSDHIVDAEKPRLLQYWSQQPAYHETICVKTFCDEEISIFIAPAKMNFKLLVEKVKGLYWAEVKLKFKDQDGDFVTLDNDNSLNLAQNQYQGRTLPIYVTRGDPVFPPSSKRRRASKSSSPILAIDGTTHRIIWANSAALCHLKVADKSTMRSKCFETFFPNVDITTWRGKGMVKGQASDNTPVEGSLLVSLRPNHIHQATIRLSTPPIIFKESLI